MSDDKAPIKDHDYDGIQEYDNPLPGWWLFTFLGTIMFAFFYYIHYDISGAGTSISAELKTDLAAIDKAKTAHGPKSDSDEELALLKGNGAALEEGRAVFAGKCSSCHGPELQGLIGPNLTDEFWIHGKGKLSDISSVIRKGVLDKGMPPWEGMLKDAEIKAVAVFVASRAGSNPPNPKPPQGEKIVPQ